MSADLVIQTAKFSGTQMRPSYLEPATAEWAGRVMENLGWTYYRQDSPIFSESSLWTWETSNHALGWMTIYQRLAWYNQICGTVSFGWVYTTNHALTFAATVIVGDAAGGISYVTSTTCAIASGQFATANVKLDRTAKDGAFDYLRLNLLVYSSGVHTTSIKNLGAWAFP